MTTKTKEDLKNLLDSFNEATTYWLSNLNQSNQSSKPNKSNKSLSSINSIEEELYKLIKLIKAHITKVGIIFKPINLKKDPNVAYITLEKLSETLILLINLIQLFEINKISKIFYNEILNNLKNLILSINQLSNELIIIFNSNSNDKDNKDDEDDEDDGRLIGVGKIWSNCDELIKLLDEGAIGLLNNKIKQNILLLDDGFEEFKEWAKNPQILDDDDDDPFGFNDDDSDSEQEEDDQEDDQEEQNDVSGEDNSEISKFALNWVSKIELIKLLISSFKKSLPKSISGELIDEINSIQLLLINLIDKFIMNFMLDITIDEEILNIINEINLQSIKLSKLGIKIHSNENDLKKLNGMKLGLINLALLKISSKYRIY